MLKRLFLILLIVQFSLAPAAAYGSSPSPPDTPSKTAAAAKGVIECSADVNWGSCLGMAAGFIPVAGDAAKIILKKGDETVEATFNTTTKKFDDVKNVSATNRGFGSADEAFDAIADFRSRTTITDAQGGRGTVAVTEINGQRYFGVNSSNLSDADKNLARSWRDRLGLSRGQDQVVFHAEAHSLMRAHEKNRWEFTIKHELVC